MARLVVNPGSPAAWEIQLMPGINSIGRGFSNDFKLTDASVSGSHCQVVLEGGGARIRDLGSTNGTFVNRAPVQEAALQAGQTVHLGGVEMLFYSDAAAPAAIPQPIPVPTAVRISGPAPVARAATPVAPAIAPAPARVARVATQMVPPPIPVPVAVPPLAGGVAPLTSSGPCKHHPKTQGRFFCNACQLFFCELCVTARAGQKFCRHCGTQCVPVQVQIARPAGPKGFFARFPSAFIYPFRGSGLLILIASTFVFAALDFLQGGLFFFFFIVVAFGYLFCYMQNIIHATANQEEEMPELPGFGDVFGGALRLAVTVLLSFGIPITFGVLKAFDVFDFPGSAFVATIALGCFYFPMAFLAVAMKDTALAANPLVVIPAILKVPAGYLVTTLVVLGILGIRLLGSALAAGAQEVGFHTRSMSVLFLTFGLRAFWSLASVYLLTVGMRTLGLLYVTNKPKFGWFDH